VKRPEIFISNNFNDLMGTPKTNLTTYKAELYDKVKNNGDNIVKQCAADEFSNFTHCFKCDKTQKFNIETKKCDTCNGTVDTATLICDPFTTLLTDLDANNLLVGANSNISNYA
jgi:tRNA U54 and U55 pseudouridine synthase Pus10